jgi:hypothetical protein
MTVTYKNLAEHFTRRQRNPRRRAPATLKIGKLAFVADATVK